MLNPTPLDDATDPYYPRLLRLGGDLNPDQRSALHEVMQPVIIDTVADIFGILDGSSGPEGFSDDCFLALASRPSRAINGSPQEAFPELEESWVASPRWRFPMLTPEEPLKRTVGGLRQSWDSGQPEPWRAHPWQQLGSPPFGVVGSLASDELGRTF